MGSACISKFITSLNKDEQKNYLSLTRALKSQLIITKIIKKGDVTEVFIDIKHQKNYL